MLGLAPKPEPTFLLKGGVRSILVAYAQVLFCTSPLAGGVFALATFVVWQHGLAGLLAMIATNAWAYALGRPQEHINDGFYGFNGLLVGLALGLYFKITISFMVLLAIASLLTAVMAAALRNLAERYVGVPVLSLPFVLVTWTALLAARRFLGVEVTTEPVLVSQWAVGLLPDIMEIYLRSLGACYFQISVISGAIVFVGLIVGSRWAALLSMVGFTAGYFVYVGLGGHAGDLAGQLIGFNFVLTAIAVGGVFVILSPASILLAAGSGALSAVVCAALAAWLEPFALPVLAIPFILVTQLLLFTFVIRVHDRGPKLVRGTPDTPEQNLARTIYRQARYPDPTVPVVYLPVMGNWVITQGPNGEHTHMGLWSHAWDFEVADASGQTYKNDGLTLDDYLAFKAPVLAQADGKVIRVIDHLADNPVGEVDTTHNWGNLIVIWHVGGVYSLLSHLMMGSATVKEGEGVVRGQVIGRVGNSGRSPVPHLHFQLQRSASVGAPTCYGEFLHYIQSDTASGPARYMTHGVPQKGDCVSPLQPDEPVRRAMTLAPGREWNWEITEGTQTRSEQWKSTIDALGERRVEVVGERTSATFFADDRYLTILDYQGDPNRLLGLFYLATARAAYTADSRFTWEDHPAVSPLLPPLVRLAHELILPFRVVGAIRTISRVERQGLGVQVITEPDLTSVQGATGRLPDRICVDWEPDRGPVRLTAWRANELSVQATLSREAS